MRLLSLEPESSASAYSATSAKSEFAKVIIPKHKLNVKIINLKIATAPFMVKFYAKTPVIFTLLALTKQAFVHYNIFAK